MNIEYIIIIITLCLFSMFLGAYIGNSCSIDIKIRGMFKMVKENPEQSLTITIEEPRGIRGVYTLQYERDIRR